MADFKTVPNHINFLAKKLCGHIDGEIQDVAIAHIETQGGGPAEKHTHSHQHLFIVVEGQVKIILDSETIILNKNEAYLVKANVPHMMWNDAEETAIVVGATILEK